MFQISRGDDIVIKTRSGAVFRLQGDRQQLSKYVEDKATVIGDLMETSNVVDIRELATSFNSGFSTINVHYISRPPKKKK